MNDCKHGKGIEYYKNGTVKYEGEYINDKYEGKGKYFYENGDFYIGEFLDNMSHGKGIDYYKKTGNFILVNL